MRNFILFLTKIRVQKFIVWTCHAWIFLRLTFNVNLLMCRRNVSSDCCSKSYICPAYVWTLEQSNRSWMSRTMLYRISKPLKAVALSVSTNVSIEWILSSIGGSFFNPHHLKNFPDGIFTDFILLPRCLLVQRVRRAHFCNDFTSLGFGQAGCLRFHPFPAPIHQIRASRKRSK